MKQMVLGDQENEVDVIRDHENEADGIGRSGE